MATVEHDLTREPSLRLSLQLNREQQDALREAASATGQSLEDFAASALLHMVEDVQRRPRPTVLSARDFDRFLALRDSDAPPAPALIKAAEEYKRRLADGSLQVEDQAVED